MNKQEFYALPSEERRIVMSKWRFEDDLTYAEIAHRMGGDVTRNMIAGMVSRLDLKVPSDKLEEHRRSNLTRIRRMRPVAPPKPKEPKVSTPRKIGVVHKAAPLPQVNQIWETLPGVMPVALMSADKGQCRWPIGHRTHTVCGCPTIEASPYCETHSRIAFKPILKEERRDRS